MTLNTLNAMTLALNVSRTWRYFINLSGSDYPTVAPNVLRRLHSHPGPSREFMTIFRNVDSSRQMYLWRAKHFTVDPALADYGTTSTGASSTSGGARAGGGGGTGGGSGAGAGTGADGGGASARGPIVTLFSSVRNPITPRVAHRMSKGEAWMTVSREFCTYATSSREARKLLLVIAYTASSPEHYFVTLARNNPLFSRRLVFNSLRLIIWNDPPNQSQHPKSLDDLYDNQNQKENSRIVHTPLLFARKFRRAQSSLKDILDSRASLPQRTKYVQLFFKSQLANSPNKSPNAETSI